MTQAAPKLLTFDDFIASYGDNERYELIDGELIDMEPTGPHEEVAAFLLRKINVEIDRLNVRWFTPARCLIKPFGTSTGFCPDVVVLDKAAIASEPLWQNEPVITLGTSVKLVVEVVSTNS
jgi:Uma2 family endonuclease